MHICTHLPTSNEAAAADHQHLNRRPCWICSCTEMNAFEEKLSDLVRLYPHLYDSSRRDYKDVGKGHSSWKEIAAEMGCSAAETKKKWNALRDKVSKAKKRAAKATASGAADGELQLPRLYVQLSWLCPYIKHRETSGKALRSRRVCSVQPQDNKSDDKPQGLRTPPTETTSGPAVTRDDQDAEISQPENLSLSIDSAMTLNDFIERLVAQNSSNATKPIQTCTTKRKRLSDQDFMSYIERRAALRDERRAKRSERRERDPMVQRFRPMLDFARGLPESLLAEFELEIAQVVFKTRQKLHSVQK